MEIPVFRLEGVVKAKNEPADFEGPLALILQLLSKDKIEIRDISISLILEQYMAYLDGMDELDLDIASEFVSMASHLAYIKTKVLLSGEDEVSELEQLISSLEELQRSDIYKQIKSASETFSGMYKSGGGMMEGPPEYLPFSAGYKYSHSADDLLEAVLRVISRENTKIESINREAAVYPLRIVYSISEKVAEILDRLRLNGDMSVSEFFSGSASRTELVATLIAVLELCKVGSVLLIGSPDEMMMTYTGSGRELDLTAYETVG